MNPRMTAALLTLSIALCGCAAAPPHDGPIENAGMTSLRFQPRFEKANGTVINAQSLPKEQVFDFRLQTGIFFPHRATLGADLPGFTKAGGEFVIELNDWLQAAADQGQPLWPSVARELTITPTQTRLGRVQIGVYTPSQGRISGRFLGDYSYLRGADQQALFLAFFDRACQVRGLLTSRDSPATVAVDLSIEGPGFYLLEFVEGLRGKHRLQLSQASAVDLVTIFH